MPKRIAKAPYRFIPLAKKVASPYWEKAISHDQPFQNSHSGTLDITMTAHADIMVGDGRKTVANNLEYLMFSNYKGRHFIPATSLKGMIRNVMEVMSFASIKNKVEDNRYAFRDVGRSDNEYLPHFRPGNILGGYLSKNNEGNYVIRSCGNPGRISQVHIEERMARLFSGENQGNLSYSARNEEDKSAKFKYDNFGQHTTAGQKFEEVGEDNGRIIYNRNPDGDRTGRIIYTGQPSNNNLFANTRNGKHFEFIFFEDEPDVTYNVSPKVIKDFKFAYFDHDENRWSIDWKANRKKLNDGEEIPIFFQLRNGQVAHLGLSYLYKLPFKHGVHDVIEHTQKKPGLDLAEAIFGHISNESRPLKSRVSFSHAWVDSGEVGTIRKEVLSSPKASYFPFYLKQNTGNRPVSYMGRSSELAGWKRYPVHTSLKRNPAPNGNENVAVKFQPLKEGATFTFSIHYHNLRTVELGAILSALTFHGKMTEEQSQIFHSIGMAKPLGYGKVKLKINTSINQEAYLEEFENYMNVALNNDTPSWHNSAQIQKLFAFCTANTEMNAGLKYMQLAEFRNVKSGNKFLRPYAHTERYIPNALSTTESIKIYKEWMQEDQTKMESLGDVHEAIHQLQVREREAFRVAFEKRKAALLVTLDRMQKERAEAEYTKRKEGWEEDEIKRIRAIKEGNLSAFMTGKKYKDIKGLGNLIEQFVSIKYHCKRNKLKELRPNGYLTEKEDIDFVENCLSDLYTKGGSKVKKEFKKEFATNAVFRKVTNWVGKEAAEKIHNNIIRE